MIVAIGNAPSSGSTYLADLLDSLPFAVCPPELHLFSPRCHFDDYEGIRAKGFRPAATASCYAAYSVRFALWELPMCGMSPADLRQILEDETDFSGFCRGFFRRYAAYRGKEARLFFEKTPENLHNAALFLEAFPRSFFLHIVRNPLFVYRSLRRNRGMPFTIAAAAWLIDVAAAYALRNHPRFYTMRYEDLVRDPEAALSRFLTVLGEKMPAESLERLYAANAYRARTRRGARWGYSHYGRMGDANVGALGPEVEKAARYMVGLKVGRRYARHFGLPEVTYDEVAGFYGYVLGAGGDEHPARGGEIDVKSRVHLSKKWLKDVIAGTTRLSDLPAYLEPVEGR